MATNATERAEIGREWITKGLRIPADVAWTAALCAAIFVLLLLNPGGYVGGGQDDWRYLQAVRCWREYGPCLPYNHWQSRWPLIAPTAALTSIFGESRLTISAAPLGASVIALFLLAAVGNKLLGRPIGWVAALAFAAIPAFSIQFTDLSIEATELLFIFGGFLAILHWNEAGRGIWAILAGLAFSLAFQTRETSAIGIIFAAIYVLGSGAPRKGRLLLCASIGFVLPLLVEFSTFAVSTGNPLWRRRLAVDHTLIPSTELIGPIDTNHSPFFNLAYIAHWRPIAGIHVHWLVDWLLNLIASGFAGPSLVLVPLLLVWRRNHFHVQTKQVALTLWLTALLYGAALAFAFAVDPKPRMMLVPLALASLALALLTLQAKQSSHAMVAYISWAAVFLMWLPLHVGHRRTDVLESKAADWISTRPDQVEIDENTRRLLALVPSADTLPGVGAGRKYLLYGSAESCDELVGPKGLPEGSVSQVESAPANLFQLRRSDSSTPLCLLRFKTSMSGERIVAAIRRSRSDGPYITGYRGA